MDMNPTISPVEKSLLDQILPMQHKHVFTKTLGDGQIEKVTRYNDLSGVWVYFFTNDEGGYELKLDGNEFLNEVEEIREFVN
jgi:hypothetical protein